MRALYGAGRLVGQEETNQDHNVPRTWCTMKGLTFTQLVFVF
jgi:hypothetical protein